MSAEQRSAEWFFERVGCATASRFKDVLAKLKSGKPSEKRETYLMEVVVERLTGKPNEHFSSAAMEHGQAMEPQSRMSYEAATGLIVEEVGFIKHPTIPMVGGSPDGTIGDDGLWESKSPYNTANHLYAILEGMPPEHMAQIQGLLWVTNRRWCDFQSYDPRLPAPLDRYVQRIERDDAYIAALEAEVVQFLAGVDAMFKTLAER